MCKWAILFFSLSSFAQNFSQSRLDSLKQVRYLLNAELDKLGDRNSFEDDFCKKTTLPIRIKYLKENISEWKKAVAEDKEIAEHWNMEKEEVSYFNILKKRQIAKQISFSELLLKCNQEKLQRTEEELFEKEEELKLLIQKTKSCDIRMKAEVLIQKRNKISNEINVELELPRK